MTLKLFILYFCAIQSIFGHPSSPSILYPPQNPISGYIVGGTDAEDGQAPFQCSLQYQGIHFCGCAILSPEWVITAAHCATSPQNIEVLVGTNDLQSGGARYNVDKAIPHESHDTPYLSHDIAVIKVKTNIEFNDKFQPIKLSAVEVPDKSIVQLTGWGLLGDWTDPNKLQVINLTVISTSKCREFNGNYVHDSHICTLNKQGEGACYGDSGSPLVQDNKLVGLVNWGRPCAEGYPDVHAKISFLYNWVLQTTGSY